MESLDQIAQGFLKDEQLPLPRVTIGAVNKSGSFNYLKSFGEEAGGPEGEPSDINALHWVASFTKVITTIAVLQCVEKGLLALDDDVSKILPEWKDARILLGHDDNKQPILKPAENTITLRQLLTHTAGMAYRFSHPLVEEYFVNRGEERLLLPAIPESYPPFLISEPGTEWRYSPGLDWAGQMVERVTGTSLDAYFKAHIFHPLGIHDATFHLPDGARPATLWARLPPGASLPAASTRPLVPAPPILPTPVEHAHGGAGLWASAPALLKLYGAALRQDPQILRPQTWESMFVTQVQESVAKRGFSDFEAQGREMRNNALGALPDGVDVGFGFGGLVTREGVEGARAEGSLSWSGLPNCYWWIDPKKGVAGLYLSQLLPTGDDKSVELAREIEHAVYKAVDGQ